MEYRPVVPGTGVLPSGLQDYHAAIPDLSPPRSQGSSTGGASSIGDYAPRMYTPPTPPTPHEDEKVMKSIQHAVQPTLTPPPLSHSLSLCLSYSLLYISRDSTEPREESCRYYYFIIISKNSLGRRNFLHFCNICVLHMWKIFTYVPARTFVCVKLFMGFFVTTCYIYL